MKELKLILFALFCTLNIVTISEVAAISIGDHKPLGPVIVCAENDNLCSNKIVTPLFTICDKRGRNCEDITTENINNDHKYNLFEIKNKEIYLENADITLEFYDIWSLLNYKIHISGTNKIGYLNSFNVIKYENPLIANEYPNLYSKDYIPFSVEGDGTLEIDFMNQVKKNTSGEILLQMLEPYNQYVSRKNISH